jgi:hypothetical protein
MDGDDGDGDEEVGNIEVDDKDVENVEFDYDDDDESECDAHTCTGDQMFKDKEEDTSSFKLMRSDILVSPSNSDDDDNEVVSKPRCVPTFAEFHDVDMDDPKLHIGMSFTSAN